MAKEQTVIKGIVLRSVDTKESDKILTVLTADKGRIYTGVERACVYNVADPVTEQLVRDADVTEGARAIGFTLGTPTVGMLGVVDDVLADRAFVDDRQHSAAELATIFDWSKISGKEIVVTELDKLYQ